MRTEEYRLRVDGEIVHARIVERERRVVIVRLGKIGYVFPSRMNAEDFIRKITQPERVRREALDLMWRTGTAIFLVGFKEYTSEEVDELARKYKGRKIRTLGALDAYLTS